jgi:GNAT superfamily N-acetyltransferase
MRVREINLANRRDVERFVRLPFDLYRGNRFWVPPLLSEARALLDPARHPFYQHSQAVWFLAENGSRVLGRIGATDPQRYNAFQGTHSARFGYFECVDDPTVATALVAAARDWASARGLTEMEGPHEQLGSDPGGVLVEGFDRLPALGVPYNPPYYDALLQGAGLRPFQDILGGYYRGDQEIPERLIRIAEHARRRGGYEVLSFGPKEDLRPWVHKVAHVFNTAFSENLNFYPLTDGEIALMAERLLSILDPRLVKLATHQGEVVGFALAYPNFGEGLQKARGRLWPLGWWHILRARKRTRRLDGNGVGVVPAHQGRGVNVLLYVELGRAIKARGYEHIEVVHVGVENVRSMADQEAAGAAWVKRHRLYRCELVAQPSWP